MLVLSYSGEYPWAGVVGAQAVGVTRQTASWDKTEIAWIWAPT